MDMPKPTEHHRKLEILAGEWQGIETMHPSPWDPKGGEAAGRTRSRFALNGFALIVDYEQERDGTVTFTGHGVWTYDKEDACYVFTWFDCMGSPPETFRGNFEGDILTTSHGAPGMHVRFTYDLSEKNRMKTRMEMSPDGENWSALFDGRYEKK